MKKWPDKQPHTPASEYNSQIEQELALYLPEKLENAVKIKQFNKGMLTLSIPNASFQMQFNAIRSQLMSKLRMNNPALISIKCVVEPSRQNTSKPSTSNQSNQSQPHIIANNLSEHARANLSAILPDMPAEVQAALNKLMK